MVFSSIDFLLGFLPVFILLYYITPKKYRNLTLLIGSILFYAHGEPKYVFMLMASVIVNFEAGKYLDKKKPVKPNKKKAIYIGIVAADVLMLALFKIIPQTPLAWESLSLPLGISFYTFQMLSYLTDVYRGDIRAEKSFIRLATYISMFPQLVAGPIVNYKEVSEDLRERTYRLADVDKGLKNFVLGLALKVLLADRLALLWNEIRTVGFESISTSFAWMGAIGYSLEIYFDFYGYSLMAVGLGQMLGFTLPENFNMPYMAKSVRDFYRRWHMTLGRWFKNYVYIPMGGSRKGTGRTIFNLLIVWILTSLWHGASINFLLWGMSLFVFITLERILDRKNFLEKSRVLSHAYVLFVIPLTWVCFAIPNLSDLGIYFGRLFGINGGDTVNTADFVRRIGDYGYLFLIGFFACTPLVKKLFDRFKDTLIGMLLLAVLFWLSVWQIMVAGNNPFMYFRF